MMSTVTAIAEACHEGRLLVEVQMPGGTLISPVSQPAGPRSTDHLLL